MTPNRKDPDHTHNEQCVILLERMARAEERILAAEKAVDIALDGMQYRLASMNEFRETIKDYQTTTMTRHEAGILLDSIRADVREVRDFKMMLEGKASQKSVNLALLIGIISFVTAVISFLTKFIK